MKYGFLYFSLILMLSACNKNITTTDVSDLKNPVVQNSVVLEMKPINYVRFNLSTNSMINGNHGDYYVFEDDTYFRVEHPAYGWRPTLYKLDQGAYDLLTKEIHKYMLVNYSAYLHYKNTPKQKFCTHRAWWTVEFQYKKENIQLSTDSCHTDESIIDLFDLRKQLLGLKKSYRVVEYE